MIDRLIKSILTAIMGLFALVVAGNNIVNLEQSHSAVTYVIGMSGNEIYPNALLPSFGESMGWVLLTLICLSEITVGIACLAAAARLFHARRDNAEFAKILPMAKLAVAGTVFVWFGLFWLGGVALYVMWQSPVGAESAASAFRIAAIGFFLLIYLGTSQSDEQRIAD